MREGGKEGRREERREERKNKGRRAFNLSDLLQAFAEVHIQF